MGSWTLIDLFVLVGVGVVLPLSVPSWGWWPVTVGVAWALARPEGWPAAMLVVPWFVVAVVVTAKASSPVVALGPATSAGEPAPTGRRRQVAGVWPLDLARSAELLAAGYAAVAAVALFQSRLGGGLFGIGEPIVQLTAVHFTYAGTGALTLARWNLRTQAGGLARAAVVFTAVAPPVVAVGFVTGGVWPQVGGAVLMTMGVWATSLLHLGAAWASRGSPRTRGLLGLSGLAPWLPMVLAVGWAAGQHADLPALSIDDMVRVHGALNALGFTVCGLMAWRLSMRDRPGMGELVA